jgi:hypothetical protein
MMPAFSLHEAREPHRRIARVDTNVDPNDDEACVALLRRLAVQYRRKPGDVILRWTGGKRVREYHA